MGGRRVNFENPIVCDTNETFAAISPNYACDFREGDVHKGYSSRIGEYFPEMAFMISKYTVPSAEMMAMEQMIRDGARYDDVACQWLRDNEEVWEGWLIPRGGSENPRQTERWKMHLPILLLCLAGGFALVWSALPVFLPIPALSSQWYDASQWMKPTTSFRSCIRFVGVVFRCITRSPAAYSRFMRRCLSKVEKRARKASAELSFTKKATKTPISAPPKLAALSTMSRQTTMALIMETFKAGREYSARERVAVSFIQEYVRTRSLEDALAARARAKDRVADGVQFAQRVVWGLEGNSHFPVGIIRGERHLDKRCKLKVTADGHGLFSDLAGGRDFVLANEDVVFEAGERFTKVELQLVPNGVSIGGSNLWLPVRELKLSLEIEPEKDKYGHELLSADPMELGDATVCYVKIVDSDKWPANKNDKYGGLNTSQSLFGLFVWQTLRGSFESESWWFVGVLIRALLANVAKPLLSIMLFDLAIGQTTGKPSLDWSFVVGAFYLLCMVVQHVTSYWYHSGWKMGYDVSLTWLLAKWTELPLAKVADVDATAQYRGTIDLITSSFFGDNNYAVFAALVSTWVNIVCVTLSPLLLFNIMYCKPKSYYENDYACPTNYTPGVYLGYDPSQFAISMFLVLGTIAITIFYKLVDGVFPTRYEREVRKYIDNQRALTGDVLGLLDNTPLYRNFDTSQSELQRVIKQMSDTRNQKFNYLLALDASGKGYEWLMDFIYVVVVIGAPIGTGIYGFTVGQISALFALVMQVRSILASLSSSTEHMRIARYLIGELADLLNADLEFLKRKTDNSHQQFTAVRRAIKDLNVDQLAIAFYRLRYANTDFIVDGTLLKVTLEGQLPLGHMHGLGSDAAGHAAAEQLEIEHGLIIDLIAGTRVPIDGCVVMGPNLTVGVVPRTPVFISNSSLLENLKYGCRRAAVTPPEGVIWHVCHALGLPRHNFNPHGGSLPMGLVELSPTERQLMSIARTLLGQPDVLLVHNLGQLEPRVARRIGVVFSMYTQGCALGRLTGGMRLDDIDMARLARLQNKLKRSSAAAKPQRAGGGRLPIPEVSRQISSEDSIGKTTPPGVGSNRRRSSCAAQTCFRRLDSVDAAIGSGTEQEDKVELLRSDGRTVIWHANVNVLHHAGVDRSFMYQNGRLVRRAWRPQNDPDFHEPAPALAAATPAPMAASLSPAPAADSVPRRSQIQLPAPSPWLQSPASLEQPSARRTPSLRVPVELNPIAQPPEEADDEVQEVAVVATIPSDAARPEDSDLQI